MLGKNSEDLCNETTMHGLAHILHGKSVWWKVMWAFISLVFFILAVNGVVIVFLKWSENPTVTDIFIQPKKIMPLPMMILSTKNLLNPVKLDKWNVSVNLKKIFLSSAFHEDPDILFPDRNSSMEIIPDHVWNETLVEYNNLLELVGATNFDELLEQFEVKCQDIVIKCSSLAKPEKCCENATAGPAITHISHNIPMRVQSSDLETFQMQLSHAVIGSADTLFHYPYRAIPFQLIKQNEELYDSPMALEAPLGKLTKVVQLMFGNHHDHWPDNNQSVILNVIELESVNNGQKYACDNSEGYDRTVCRAMCMMEKMGARAIVTGCECSGSPYFVKATNYCDPWQLRQEQCSVFSNPTATNKEIVESCFGDTCPLNCKRTRLLYSVQTIDFDVQQLARGWNMTLQEAQVKAQQMALIRFKFHALEEIVVEQRFSMGLSSALSEIGGQIGLFIGASLITFIHLILFSIDTIFKLCKSITSSGVGPTTNGTNTSENTNITGSGGLVLAPLSRIKSDDQNQF